MKRGIVILLLIFAVQISLAQNPQLKVQWNNTTMVSKSTPTLQVVGNPMLRKTGAMHNGSFAALKALEADYVRYVPWFPYPKLAVAELDAPTSTKTSWDFSLIDPMTLDFFNATKGHSIILNFSTIPQWMFKTDNMVSYPADPNEVGWSYGGGSEFRDTTLKELTDYYVRLISWYSKGGFTDELGVYHKSGHHYDIPYWEVLNEPDLEHGFTPQKLFQNAPFSCISLRFAGLFGPGRDPGKFFTGKINIPNGLAPVNLLHLDDAVGMTMQLMENISNDKIINVVSQGHPSRMDFYSQAAKRSGLEPPIFVPECLQWKIVSSSYTGYRYKHNLLS